MNYGLVLSAFSLTMLLASPGFCSPPSQVNITDGSGEQVSIGKGLFGHKSAYLKDRFGDGYEKKNGWFGRKDMGASVLGNSAEYHKGIFGHSDGEVKTIFGTAQYKKGWFSEKTNVNVSPLAAFVSSRLKASPVAGAAAANTPLPLLPGVTAPYVAPVSPQDVR